MFKCLMFKENREDYPHNLIKFRVKDLSGVDPEPGPTIAKKTDSGSYRIEKGIRIECPYSWI